MSLSPWRGGGGGWVGGGTLREGANWNPGGLFKENVSPWQYGKY